jgi:hypothetical protein
MFHSGDARSPALGETRKNELEANHPGLDAVQGLFTCMSGRVGNYQALAAEMVRHLVAALLRRPTLISQDRPWFAIEMRQRTRVHDS